MILNNHWVYSNSWSGCSSIGCPRKEEEYVLNFRWLLLVDAFQLKCMLFRSNWRFIFYFTYLKYRKKKHIFFLIFEIPLYCNSERHTSKQKWLRWSKIQQDWLPWIHAIIAWSSHAWNLIRCFFWHLCPNF